MELHKICRVCLKSDLLVSIYSPTFLLRPIEMMEKLNICKIDELLSKFPWVCQSCLYRLLDAYNLQELAIASERQLRQDELTINHQSLMQQQTETYSLKKTAMDRMNFTNFCDMPSRNVEENVADDMLNDVEIDVSSLTRSDADDTLSEVFEVCDAHINCQYEAATRGAFSDTFVGNISGTAEEELQNVAKQTSISRTEQMTTSVSKRSKKISEMCLECGKSFSTSGYLALHKLIHTGEKKFKCKLCQRRFVQKSNLRLHQRVHSGERRFQCEICAKLFTTSSNLKAHNLNVHNEKRDYQCEQCEKRFKSTRELRRHIPIHSLNKENKCHFCQKAFSKRSYLSVHLLTVHKNVKKHKCKDCYKVFASKSNLKCHMRIHSGEKPYQCKYCVWKFNQSSALLRHVQKKHPNRNDFNKSEDEPKKFIRSPVTENLDFAIPEPPNTSTYGSQPTTTAENGTLDSLNPLYNPSMASITYDYHKIGAPFFTPS